MTTHICFLFTWHVHRGTVSLGTQGRAAPGWWILGISGDESGQLVNQEWVFKISIQWHVISPLHWMVKASHIVTPDLHVSGRFYSISWTVCVCACVCAQLLSQSCPTLCNPMDCSPPGSSVHGISRQEYWNGLAFPPPRDLPDTSMELVSLMFSELADKFFSTVSPGLLYQTNIIWHLMWCT